MRASILSLQLLMMISLAACNSSVKKESAPATSDASAKAPEASSSTATPDPAKTASSAATSSADTSPANVEVLLANHAEFMQRVAAAKGRVVVVDIWSTSCLPCMKEFPHLVELARRWPEDIVCMSINVDYLGLPKREPDSYLPAVAEYLKKVAADPANMVNVLSTEADTDILTKFEVESMPAILVFNRQGKQAAKLTVDTAGTDGLSYAGDVVPVVEKLIEEL